MSATGMDWGEKATIEVRNLGQNLVNQTLLSGHIDPIIKIKVAPLTR